MAKKPTKKYIKTLALQIAADVLSAHAIADALDTRLELDYGITDPLIHELINEAVEALADQLVSKIKSPIETV